MNASTRALFTLACLAVIPGRVLTHDQGPPTTTRNAIAGRVTDPSGAPVAGAMVTLVVRDLRNGTERFHPANVRLQFTTDENGRYNSGPVTPGEYFVVTVPRNGKGVGTRDPIRSGFRVTYYPSAVTAAEAKPVVVNVREPQTADITLQPARLAVVTGTVLTSAGTPASGGTLRVALGDGLYGIGSGSVPLGSDGRFAIAGVPPGTYFLHYSEGPWPPPRDVEMPLISGATVIVRDEDATNIRVVPIRMVRATGRVVIEPKLREQFEPGGFTVGGSPVNWEGNPGPQRAGRLRDDLTFEFRTWPGRGMVRVFPEGTGWMIKSVRHRGADVPRTGIDFRQGEEISGLEIELVRGPGRESLIPDR